ncbi:MAG: DUF4352 domain-containing protein [Bacteroidales bacterium]|nr:DUF4352 domain-containing protein [Bacteroidales bacterium]
MSQKCIKCGHEFNDGENFCPICGAKVFTTEQSSLNKHDVLRSNNETNEIKEKPVYKKWWFWTAIAGSILSVCVVASVIANIKPKETKTYKVGETVNCSDWTYVVNSVSDTKTIKTQTSNYNFLVVNLTITNNKSYNSSILSSDFKVIKDKNEYSLNYSAELKIDNSIFSAGSVIPGGSYTANIVFETPTEHINDKYTLVVNALSINKANIELF